MKAIQLPTVPRAGYLDPPAPPSLPVPTPEHPVLLSSSLGLTTFGAHPALGVSFTAALISIGLVALFDEGIVLATLLLVANAIWTASFARDWLRQFVRAEATTDGLRIEGHDYSVVIPYSNLLWIRGGRFPFQFVDRWVEVGYLGRSGHPQTTRFFLDPITLSADSKPIPIWILEAKLQESRAQLSSAQPDRNGTSARS